MDAPMEQDAQPFDRSKRRPDILVKSIPWFAMAAWVIFIISLLVVGMAKPSFETFFDRYYDISLPLSWDKTLLLINYQILWVLFIVCGNGVLINSRRQRRKEDRYNKSLIIIGIVSLLGIISYHVFYA